MSWRYLPPVRSPIGIGAIGAGLFPAADAVATARGLVSREYGTDEMVLTDSGTSALRLALEAIPVAAPGKPALVAMPAYACYDLATAADGAGVRVVLYDVDPNTLSPDLASLEHALSMGASAVVVVHLYGLSVDLDAITRIVAAAGAVLIEDAAQAVGASYRGRPLGSFGAFGVLSFGRGKGRTAGAGGALLVNDPCARELLLARADPGLPVHDPLGSVAKLAVQWLLGGPAAYRIPASLPFLGLGETPYHRPIPGGALGRRAAAILATTWDASLAEASVRRGNAARWNDVLAGRSQVKAVEPLAGSVPGFLRYPVRLPSGVLDDRARSLGMIPGYPTALADLRGFAERCLPTGRPFPGGRELAMRLVTWPTHGWVTEADRRAVDEWVSRWWARPRSTDEAGR
ncbi:MAG: DegT/DnrJ/EryC1/StrS family aminotransferase [Gemmatimonadota bacterium]